MKAGSTGSYAKPVQRRLWKPSELQRMLGIGRRQTYALIERGAFGDPVRIGNSFRIPTEAVDEFIARGGEKGKRS